MAAEKCRWAECSKSPTPTSRYCSEQHRCERKEGRTRCPKRKKSAIHKYCKDHATTSGDECRWGGCYSKLVTATSNYCSDHRCQKKEGRKRCLQRKASEQHHFCHTHKS